MFRRPLSNTPAHLVHRLGPQSLNAIGLWSQTSQVLELQNPWRVKTLASLWLELEFDCEKSRPRNPLWAVSLSISSQQVE